MGSMKAITQDRYGPPEILRLAEIPVPELDDDRMLIRVKAASVNPADLYMMLGKPWVVRAENGLRRPKNAVQGTDGAGIVEAVGAKINEFAPGDEVWGSFRGSYAEYATALERNVVHKPANVPFEKAAVVPIAGLTALQGLRDKGGLQPGQRVLVNGASGGVGTFAVMIAKAMGAHVTGVCSTANVEMVRSIGADEVIDYTKTDYTKGTARYDVILDTVTTHGIRANRRVMTPTGRWVQAGMLKKRSVLMIALRALKTKLSNVGSKQRMMLFLSRNTKDDLVALNEYLKSGAIDPTIGRSFPLTELAAAMQHQAEGHARGKTVITI
jgi:NADPH:quinone reductase-like Zn-dependent oxidoreductase